MTDVAAMNRRDVGEKGRPGIVQWGADMVETLHSPLACCQPVKRLEGFTTVLEQKHVSTIPDPE